MFPSYITRDFLERFIQNSLEEDKGSGDHSSLASISPSATKNAHLIVKDQGIIAGIELSKHIFSYIDPGLQTKYVVKDGDVVKNKDIAFEVYGNARSILLAERLILNCMQRMSGIATTTHQFVEKISHTKAKILDTRKTTPNFRALEKWGVKIGGGENHRFGLFDMIILKDNHVDFAGGISHAIEKSVTYLKENKLDLKIIIETRTLAEVAEVLTTGKVDRIMLDNMSVSTMKEAVQMVNKKFETEASGGVNLETVKEIAETGVDFISVGALTHSIKSLDLSLKAFK